MTGKEEHHMNRLHLFSYSYMSCLVNPWWSSKTYEDPTINRYAFEFARPRILVHALDDPTTSFMFEIPMISFSDFHMYWIAKKYYRRDILDTAS